MEIEKQKKEQDDSANNNNYKSYRIMMTNSKHEKIKINKQNPKVKKKLWFPTAFLITKRRL
jgi:hypothetical protein